MSKEFTFTTEPTSIGGKNQVTDDQHTIQSSHNAVVDPEEGYVPMWIPQWDEISFAGDVRNLDANDGDLLLDVPDLTGNENHINQSDDRYRPIYKRSAVHGYPCIRFDGDRDHLELDFENDDVQQPFQIFVVFRLWRLPLDNSTEEYIISDFNNNVRFGIDSIDDGGDHNDVRWYQYAGSDVTSGTADNQLYIANLLYDGRHSHLRLNGTRVLAQDVGTSAFSDGFYVGGRNNNNNSSVDVLQYIFYPTDVSEYETEIEYMLDQQYRLL